MNLKIKSRKLGGEIEIISSKSEAHRLLICAALSAKPTKINCNALSDDITATVSVLNALGAEIKYNNGVFVVNPITNIPKSAEIDVGESGSTLRFILPIVCALGIKTKIKMHGKLPQRPLSPLWEELIKNGAKLQKNGDYILTDGKLNCGEFNIVANVSSQFISGLLFALPLISGKSQINLIGETESADYIKMTLYALSQFGINYGFDGKTFKTNDKKYISNGVITVGGDWSNGAFWLCLGAISETVKVKGLSLNSLQGDKKVIEILNEFGANVTQTENEITVNSGELKGIKIDCKNIPDLVPALCTVASVANGETVFYNASRLRLKESDRISAIVDTLTKLGVKCTETEDGLKVIGGAVNGGKVDSYNDHRIAMMSAVLSSVSKNEITILDANAVNKSYPSFYNELEKLGAVLEVLN